MAQILNPVRLATVENISISTALSIGTSKIDGVVIAGNDRILVKSQTNKTQNGIYVVNSSTGVLARASDFAATSVQTGSTILFVQEGSQLADTGWILSSNGSVTVGTDQIEFEKFSNNLKLSGYDVTSSIVLRAQKGYPLTIDELDNNFKYLATSLDSKFNTSSFTPTAVADKINSLSAAQGGLNAWKLRDKSPSSTATASTVVIRDASGDIYTNVFHGDLSGNAQTSSLATYATLANNVDGTVAVANGGTGGTTAAAARSNLGAVNIAGDTMTGKLVLPGATNARASLTVLPKSADPAVLVNGDIWASSTALIYRLNDTTKTIASIESPAFTGFPTAPTADITSNSTAIATTAYVQLHRTQINNLISDRAPKWSPVLQGVPESTTPATTDSSTKIATTAYVNNKIDAVIPSFYNKIQIDGFNSGINNARATADATLQAQIDELKLMKGIPVGTVMHYAANSVPAGWLKCNGALLSTAAYPQLFGKIGYTYGGSGTLFNLPDLRGEFLRGHDDGRLVDTGRAFGSSQSATAIRILLDKYAQGLGAGSQYPDGALAITGSNIDGFTTPPTNAPELMRYPGSGLVNVSSNNNYITAQATYGPGGGDNISFITRSRNVAMMPCIKAFGDVDNPDLINATAVLESISNKVDRRGDTMSGALTLTGNPVLANHAANKAYVDAIAAASNYTITYGNTVYSTNSYTNIVGSWHDSYNFFDVFPPAGKTMGNLVAFLPSIAVLHYAGTVNGDDSTRCTWANLGDRVRVWVQNTEQRWYPAANWIAFWR